MKNEILRVAAKYENTAYTEHDLGEHGCVVPHREPNPIKGFDCSEFVRFVLKEAGYKLADDLIHAKDFYYRFGNFISENQIESGDLVFFTRTGRGISHIGILVTSGIIIHCNKVYGKVCYSYIEDLLESRFPKNIVPSSKTKFFSNPVGYKTY